MSPTIQYIDVAGVISVGKAHFPDNGHFDMTSIQELGQVSFDNYLLLTDAPL